jgi:hypothetical protein
MEEPTPHPNAGKKFVILGTAPTWKLAPWDDPTAVIAGLNDAYLMDLPRFDLWYDLHPFGQFFYRDPRKKVQAHQVPAGMFLRPQGHLDWLAKQSCPVFVQQADPRVPHAQVFPRQALEARFGTWFDSSPAWMLVHAIAMGFQEVHIYGIHLASEMEYIKQKPNMTFLCGLAVGAGIKLVVPKESPLLQSTHRYAFEPDPTVPVQDAQRRASAVQAEAQTVAEALKASKSWFRPSGDPLLRDRLAWLQTKLADQQQAVAYETYRKRALTGAM